MRSNRTVLVTGANGFVGQALCEVLAASGLRVRRVVRSAQSGLADAVPIGNIGAATDWRSALEDVSGVVHLAARTHVVRETAPDALAEYRRVNVEGTRALAEQAARVGVRRLVFMSSIKVNGEATEQPFTESDATRPEDAYGISKWKAEQALGVRPRLLPCPPALLKLGATLAGKRSEFARLGGSLQVDSSAARHELDWRPRLTLAQGLAETARWYYSPSRT